MYILIAILIGIIIGFIRRGSITSIFQHPYKKWLLGALGLGIILFLHISYYFSGVITPYLTYIPILHFLGFLLLLLMFVFNLDDIGSILIALGLTFDFIEIFINGGYMPVSQAVIDIMPANSPLTESITQGFSAIYSVLDPGATLLSFFGVILPVPFFSSIITSLATVPGLSVGLSFILIGSIFVTQQAMLLTRKSEESKVVLQREEPPKRKPEPKTVVQEPREEPTPAQHQPSRGGFDSKTEELFFEEFPLPKDPLDKIFAEDDYKSQTKVKESVSGFKKTPVDTSDVILEDLDRDVEMLTRPLGTGIINTREVRENLNQTVKENNGAEGFFASEFLKDKVKSEPVQTDEIFGESEVSNQPGNVSGKNLKASSVVLNSQDFDEVTKELLDTKSVFFDLDQYNLFIESIKDEDIRREIETKLDELTRNRQVSSQDKNTEQPSKIRFATQNGYSEEKLESEKNQNETGIMEESESVLDEKVDYGVESKTQKGPTWTEELETVPEQPETVSEETQPKEESSHEPEFEVIDTLPPKPESKRSRPQPKKHSFDTTEITGVVDTVILPETHVESEPTFEDLTTEEIPDAVLVEEPKKRLPVKNKDLLKSFAQKSETPVESKIERSTESEATPEQKPEQQEEAVGLEDELVSPKQVETEPEIEEVLSEAESVQTEIKENEKDILTEEETIQEVTEQVKPQTEESAKSEESVEELKQQEEISEEITPEAEKSDKIKFQNGFENQTETKEELIENVTPSEEITEDEVMSELTEDRLSDFIFDEDLTEQEREFLFNNIDNLDEFIEDEMQQQFIKRGSFIQNEGSGYYVNKAYKEKISQMDRSEEEMMNVWAQVSQENWERKQNRRRQASRNYKTDNPYREEAERAKRRKVERERQFKQQQDEQAQELKAQQNNYYNKTSEVVNTTAGNDVRNLSDAERRAAGYEKVTIEVQGKSISFWQKKN